MSRRVRGIWIWLGASLCLFAAASVLTSIVTAINDEPLIAVKSGAADLGPPPVTFEGGQMKIDQAAIAQMQKDNTPDKQPKLQLVAIYARQPTDELSQKTDIAYFSDHTGENATLSVTVPAGAQAKIVLTHLKDEKSCTVLRGDRFARPDSIVTGGQLPVRVRKYTQLIGRTYYLVDPGAPDSAFSVSCKLDNIFQHHTYTERTATFEFTDVVAGLGAFNYSGLAGALMGFAPLPRETVNFGGIDGADQFRFYGGYQDQKISSFESARALTPDQQVHVTWSDVNREQSRDLILILIGTLIGLGVGTAIEALRHLIDEPEGHASRRRR